MSPVLQAYVLLVNENGSVALVTADLGRVAANYEPSERYVETEFNGSIRYNINLYSTSDRTVVWSSIITTASTIGQSSFIPTSMVPVASTLVATLTKTKNAYSLTILYVNEERRSVDELTSFDIHSEKELVSYSFHSQKGIFCVLGMYLI